MLDTVGNWEIQNKKHIFLPRGVHNRGKKGLDDHFSPENLKRNFSPTTLCNSIVGQLRHENNKLVLFLMLHVLPLKSKTYSMQ